MDTKANVRYTKLAGPDAPLGQNRFPIFCCRRGGGRYRSGWGASKLVCRNSWCLSRSCVGQVDSFCLLGVIVLVFVVTAEFIGRFGILAFSSVYRDSLYV